MPLVSILGVLGNILSVIVLGSCGLDLKVFITKQAQLGVLHSRIQVELGFILPDSQSKTEPKCSRHRTKFWGDTAQKMCIPGGHCTYFLNRVPIGGGHRTYFLDGRTIGVGTKTYPGWGGHRTYFVDGANNWVGTPHNIERSRYP